MSSLLFSALAAWLTLQAPTPTAAPSKLTVSTFTAKPEGFLVNSALIAGAKEAVLVDAQFTRADAHRLVAMILESKKVLTTVYLTHHHPDHYFGYEVIRQAFPKAKFVALPSTIAAVKSTWKAKLAQWKPMYGEGLTAAPPLPVQLKGNTITLEGETLEIKGPVQGDSTDNTYVWIPSIKTVIAGDLVYNGVHPWTAETAPASRKAWAATIDQIAALNPTAVVPGHQTPDAKADPAALKFMKDYLAAFDEALTTAKTAEALQAQLKAKYPNLALDIILTLGAQAAFPAKK